MSQVSAKRDINLPQVHLKDLNFQPITRVSSAAELPPNHKAFTSYLLQKLNM